MRRETLKNGVQTTLDGAIDNSTTSITVADGSDFPSEGDFRIAVSTNGSVELMLVTARSSNTLTVTRGAESTSAVAHNNGADVIQILTEDAVEEYIRQNTFPFHNYSPALRIYNNSGTPIGESSFTWVNQGSATATDINNSILLKGVTGTGANLRGKVITAPSAPYSVIAAVQMFHLAPTAAGGQPRGGLLFRESGTGEMIVFFIRQHQDTGGVLLVTERFTDATTFSANQDSTYWTAQPGSMVWLKIEDNNTNLIFHVSLDGVNFQQVYSEGRTAFMAGGPDQIGFGVNASHASAVPWLYLHSFKAE